MINLSNFFKRKRSKKISRVEAIIKMKGKDENAEPIKVGSELIFGWDIDLNLKEFSNEQIEEFYDKEAGDEKH